MKNDEKGLQNFTVDRNIKPLAQKLTSEEIRSKFARLMTLSGEEYDELFSQIQCSLNDNAIAAVKDRNLLLIQEQIIRYVRNTHNGLPSITLLASLTNLSRVTVTNHLKIILSGDLEADKKAQHRYLFDVILTDIGKRAINGNLKFAKLYLDTIIKLEEKDCIKLYVQNQQNNILVSK